MGLFDSPEEKEKKRLYKEEMKSLAEQMQPTGKIFMTAKWDDNLGVISIGSFGMGTIIKYGTIKDVQVNEEVKIVTDTVGKIKKKGVVTRTLVGGALLGPVGAVVGGATAKSKNESQAVTRQEVVKTIIVTRDDPYQQVLSFSYDKELEMKLREILNHNQIEHQQPEMIEKTVPANTDSLLVADELIKLKQLVDAGVLSEEEFKNQKSKLLGK